VRTDAAPLELQHKNVHARLGAPFHWVKPSYFRVQDYVRKRAQPDRQSLCIGTLKPHTRVNIPKEYNFDQPWVRHRSGYIPFDAYANDTTIATKKYAVSCLSIKDAKVTATLEYFDHCNYHFTLYDQNHNILFERYNHDQSSSFRHSQPIALYTVQGKNGSSIGWYVVHGDRCIVVFPHKGKDGRLRIFSYHIQCAQPGALRTTDEQNNLVWSLAHTHTQDSCIFSAQEEYIDIWAHKSLPINTADPLEHCDIPTIYRIVLPKGGTAPSLQEVPPPNDIAQWPQTALSTWTPLRLFLSAIFYNLQSFKAQVLCSIPQKMWDYIQTEDPELLIDVAPQESVQRMIKHDISILRAYAGRTPIKLEALLLMPPKKIEQSTENAPSKMMVLLDAD